MKAARERTVIVMAIVIMALGLMFAIIPELAFADESWAVVGVFGGDTGNPDPLTEPDWVSVNESAGHEYSGDVYVVDRANRVERFSSTGAYLGKFNGSGTYEVEGKTETGAAAPTGAFSNPAGVAVDSDPGSASFGDVYVIDEGHDVVDKFTGAGAYLGQITGACPAAGTCAKVIRFVELDGVAVDPNGTVWIEDDNNGSDKNPAIDDFSDAQPNVFIATRTSQASGFAQAGLAVDSEDDLYVVQKGSHVVAKLNSSGEVLGVEGEGLDGGVTASGVAVEPLSGDVYIDTGTSIAVVSNSESLLESFGSGLFSAAGSLAVNHTVGADGYAYLLQPALGTVIVFEDSPTPQPPPPAPKSNAATPITDVSADLQGELNPEGLQGGVGYYFSYNSGPGATCTGPGSVSTPLDNGGFNVTGSTEAAVSATITGLEPSEEYVYCLIAAKYGVTVGSEVTFETVSAPPTVISESAENTEGSGEGKFSARINPNHSKQETTYKFEYSKEGSTSENTLAGAIKTVEGESAIPAEAFGEEAVTSPTVNLFPPKNTYYYRVVVTNGEQTTGKVQAYTKLPIVAGENASALTLTSATLGATINPDWQETTYHFEYSTSKQAIEKGEGEQLPGASTLGEEFKEDPVSTAIGALQPNTGYYYRVVAENETTEDVNNANEGKPAGGEIEQFTTESLPIVSTGEAQSITRSSATLEGTVTPIDQPTSYYFQYLTEADYQAALAKDAGDPYAESETTITNNLGAGSAPQAVGPVTTGGLLSETTYRYRIVAHNEFGNEHGATRTFTTSTKTAPGISTGPAINITPAAATLTGTVTTNGLSTRYGFEVATTPGLYGPITGLGTLGGVTTESVSTTLTNLQPGTTYYYRVTATNIDGTTQGAPQSFTTPGLPTTTFTAPTAPATLAFTIPPPEKPTVTHPKPPSAAEKLKKALKACSKDKNKTQRVQCEKTARKKYKAPGKKHGRKK